MPRSVAVSAADAPAAMDPAPWRPSRNDLAENGMAHPDRRGAAAGAGKLPPGAGGAGPAPRRSDLAGFRAALLRRALPVLRPRHPGGAARGGDRRLRRRPDRRDAQPVRSASAHAATCCNCTWAVAAPANWTKAQLARLVHAVRDAWRLPADAEMSIDCDPRRVGWMQMQLLQQPGLQPRQLRRARPRPQGADGHRPAPFGGADRRRLRGRPLLRHGIHQPRTDDRPAAPVRGQLARHAASPGGDGARPHHAWPATATGRSMRRGSTPSMPMPCPTTTNAVRCWR